MTRHRLLILLQWLLLSLPATLEGQAFRENNFVRYTTAEGLSNNYVYNVAQDSMGYIWAATASGLNRYNGSRFTQFHSNDDDRSLSAEELPNMTWLDKHRLAVFTAGLHIVDTRTGETRNVFVPYHNKQYQYKFNLLEAVKGDENGDLFILTRSGFYHFDKNYALVSRFDYYSDKDVPYNHFYFGRELLELDAHRFLIVSIGGLYVYDKRKKQVEKFRADHCPPLSKFLNYPGDYWSQYNFLEVKRGVILALEALDKSAICIDLINNRQTATKLPFDTLRKEFHWRTKLIPLNDSVYFITSHFSGFFKMKIDPRNGAIQFDPEKYCASYLINGILNDRDNNLWIATNRGLLREDEGRSQVQLAVMPKQITDSVPNARFDDIFSVGDKVYAGTRFDGGLLIFDKKTLRFEKQILFRNYDNKRGNSIFAIVPVDSESLMLATDNPLLLFNWRTQKEKLLHPPGWNGNSWQSDLRRDRKGNIWVSAAINAKYVTSTGKFITIPTHPKLLSVPFEVEEDQDGNIWMTGHGLARYNVAADSFDILIDSFPAIKMMDRQINAMVIDKNNNIWLNSANNGLAAYNINTKKFRHFTRKDGLPDNNIASMTLVGEKLWMATFSGLACLDLQSLKIISFGQEDGFPDMPIAKGAGFYYDESERQLYIGFANAIARFNPYEILKRKLPPRVFIETVSINGAEQYLPADKISTSWRNNELMITIGSINFSDGNSQNFAYRILNHGNEQWQQLGNQPSFSISNLSPGDYRIQVKSFSVKNRWPEQVNEIMIEVTPPFWQRTWFIILMALLLSIFGYIILQWRTGVARKKEMEKTQIEKLKADEYKNMFELEQITNYFSSSLADKKTVDDVLWDVTSNLISQLNYVDCMMYLWNADKTKMIQKAAFGPKGKPEIISASDFDVVPGQGVVGYVMETLQPILIDDTRKDSRYRVDDAFRLSEICVPIIHNGELIGIIDSEHHEPGYFKERDIKILTTIATLIGNKLTQIKSEETLEAKRKELDIINKELAEAQLSALQAQMNPHFVFNALNSIKRMILDGDNEKASRYLSKFALMIRMTLNHTKEVFVTLDENIEYIRAYLDMEKLRFDDSFMYKICTDDNIEAADAVIPSLMIQPLVENAIWHGLMQVQGEKKIRIGFTQEHNKITCTIEDNGIGIRKSEADKAATRPLHRSVGLENLRKRIKIMNEKYDTGCSLEIADLKDGDVNARGTLVVLRFNVINS